LEHTPGDRKLKEFQQIKLTVEKTVEEKNAVFF